jgi:hypothetical protein
MSRRDEILLMDNAALAAVCQFEFFKGSGPGGQKRNKTSSAVRVKLAEFDISTSDCTERSQHRNRDNALNKLKIAIALQFREEPPEIAPESWDCSIHSPHFPLFAAQMLDLLSSCEFNHQAAAEKWGKSQTSFLKKLFRVPEIWQFVQRERELNGLPKLRPPA